MSDTNDGGTLGERTVEEICSIPGVRMMTAADIPEDVMESVRKHFAAAIDKYVEDEIVKQALRSADCTHD